MQPDLIVFNDRLDDEEFNLEALQEEDDIEDENDEDNPDEGTSPLFGRLRRLNTIEEDSNDAGTEKDRGSIIRMNSTTDDSSVVENPFETMRVFIKQIFYLSESTLLIMTKSCEFRLFYTQKFSNGEYNVQDYKYEELKQNRS